MDLPDMDLAYAPGQIVDPPAYVIETQPDIQPTGVSVSCLERAADEVGVHPDVLWAVMLTEGGQSGKVTYNADSTFDAGIMAINSQHIERLTVTYNISPAELVYNGCANVAMSAILLKEALASETTPINSIDDYFYALAKYHRWAEDSHREAYAKKLEQNMEILLNGF